MNTSRLYAVSKRRRQVYLKKVMIFLSIVMFAIGLGVVSGGSNSVSAQDNMNSISEKQKYYKSIEITRGDTLWDIAEKYMNDDYKSVQSYIKEIKKINGLLGDDIYEGQYLTIPYFDTV